MNEKADNKYRLELDAEMISVKPKKSMIPDSVHVEIVEPQMSDEQLDKFVSFHWERIFDIIQNDFGSLW